MKTIYINGRFLTQDITGVQRVAEEIVKRIDVMITDKVITEYKFCILTPKKIKRILNLKNIPIKSIGNLSGHAWEQIDLPLFVKRKMLINFCNTAPIYKKNQIVYIHDVAIFDVPEGFSDTFIKVYSKIFNSVTKRARKIITVSEFSAKRLIHYFPHIQKKISFSYLGIEHIKYLNSEIEKNVLQKFNLKKHTYFLAVSSANPNKNFNVISEMLEKSPPMQEKFILVGGNSSKVFSQEKVLSQKIEHLGYVEDEELIILYKNAKGFIFPSKYEGFGLPPIEAMSQGCPVIASKCAAIPEVLQDNAIYFKYKDYHSLYLALEEVKKPDIYQKRLTEFVNEKYSWERTTKHLYNTILDIQEV